MILVSTKERIMQFLDYKEIKLIDFYKKTDIKRGFLDSDKLKSSVSDVFIAKIIAVYPELNLEWLLTGEGSMLKGGEGKEVAEAKEPGNKGNINDYLLEYIELLKEKLAKVEAELEEHRQRTKSAAAQAERKSA